MERLIEDLAPQATGDTAKQVTALYEEYATMIARDWNVPASGSRVRHPV